MTDEEVIKRKLLIDGDGTGDERRLNILQKSIVKFANEENPEEMRDSMDRLLIILSQCEFSVKKSRKVAAMNEVELDNYKNLSRKITKDIEEEKKKIEKTKVALLEAKRIRKNKMEYDVLGKVINQQRDRKKTQAQYTALEAELANLEKTRNDVQRRLDSRRRMFHGLVLMLHQLQATLSEDEASSSPIEDSPADDLVMEIDVSVEEVIGSK